MAADVLTALLSSALEHDEPCPVPGLEGGEDVYLIAPEATVQAAILLRMAQRGVLMSELTEELDRLDLNRRRENPIEDAFRARAKIDYSQGYIKHAPGDLAVIQDAHARVTSAVATLVTHVTILAPDAAHGKEFRRGRPRRAKSELTKAVEWIRDNLRDNLKCFNLYAVLAVLEKKETVEKLFEEGIIDITRVNVDLERGRVYYRTRSGQEKSVSFTRLDNIINDR
jgi:hypothetical protein